MADIYDANKKIIYDLRFSDDGNSIIAGNQDGSLYFLSGDLTLSRTFRVASHGHTLFSQHPSGAQIAVATGMIGERTITIVDGRTGRTIQSTPLKADWVQYCLDGSILACGASFWKDFKLLRSDSLEEVAAFSMPGDCIAVSPDRNLLVCR